MQKRIFFHLIFAGSIMLLALSCSKTGSEAKPDDQTEETAVPKYFLRAETPVYGSYRAYLYNLDYSLKWKADFSGSNYLLPVVAKQTIYFTMGFGITAVDMETGATQWQVSDAAGYFTSIAVRNDTLYCNRFTTNVGTLQARNALTGELYWSASSGSASMSLAPGQLDGDYYYFVAGALKAFNLKTRKIDWQKNVSPSLAIPFAVMKEHIILSRPAAGTDGSSDLYCIDKATGYVNWNRPDIFTGFWMYKNLVITRNSGSDQGLTAFDTATANIAWKRFYNTSVSASAMAGSRAFIAGYHNFNEPVFFCADVITGDTLWKRPLSNLMFDKLLVVNNVLYANINQFSVTPTPASAATISFDARTGALIDSAKIGPGLMVLTSAGKLLY